MAQNADANSRKRKGRKESNPAPATSASSTHKPLWRFDLEALGLICLGLGIFLLASLLPLLPTGAVGVAMRGLFIGRLGWLAFALPLPFIAVGSLFVLRHYPRHLWRYILGYVIVVLGLWLLLLLPLPQASGAWGAALGAQLRGAAGVLAYVAALLIISFGVEYGLAWPLGSIGKRSWALLLRSSRNSWQAAAQARRALKAHAAFQADVALVRHALKAQQRDLAVLAKLYPSSDISSWQAQLDKRCKMLAAADEDSLAESDTLSQAWQEALETFVAERCQEFTATLSAETQHDGQDDYSAALPAIDLERQLVDLAIALEPPMHEAVRITRPLDDVRKTLVLDLTALREHYRSLQHERDSSLRQLEDNPSPKTLQGAHQQHEERLQRYRQQAQARQRLQHDAEALQRWRSLPRDLLQLSQHYPSRDELRRYGESLAEALREHGRDLLQHYQTWRDQLNAVAEEVRPPGHGVAETLQMDAFYDAQEYSDAYNGDTADGLPNAEDFQSMLNRARQQAYRDADALDADIADNSLDDDDDADSLDSQGAPEKALEPVPELGGFSVRTPGLDLLDPAEQHSKDLEAKTEEIMQRTDIINQTLGDFKLQGRANPERTVRGPSVTRFEVEPAPGEKISRFASLSDDLALALAVGSVRIEAPIPGKSVIGIEVPNAIRDLVRFREAAESRSFQRSKARLPLILGKSIDGDMHIADLSSMPHLLIAGSTGSGKSVAVNTLIGSLVYKFLPDQLRFVMIDPKMVELTPFDGIPHMVRPVVTDPLEASGVLLGTVAHMERRYKMMRKIGVKNLEQYNRKAKQLDLPSLPYMVIIIDELADLMITSPKETESAVMRLAQMARATGMHLVLATQRPSVDILTNSIKVNVPARIAFAVSSGHDSRTILNIAGAESLTGMGDMLFYQPGHIKPVRLQGPYISEDEIHELTEFLRRQYFDDDFVEAYGSDFEPVAVDDSTASGLIDWNDEKLREAAELVSNEGQASVSRFQRRLGVGHARAGKLMDSLEAMAIVGPHQGSKPRDVLVKPEDLPDIFGS